MDVFSNLLYFLVIGVLVLPSEGIVGPTTDGPTTEGPTTEGPTTDGPTTDGPTTAGPTAEPPIVPGPGIPIYDDCVDYHEKGCPNNEDSPSAYFIKARNAAGYEPNSNICRTQEQVPACSGVGWTYIGTFLNHTTQGNWSYESEIWTAKGIDQVFLNSQFWSANVTEICLSSPIFSIRIPVAAPSLRSLFFEKRILNMTSQQWVDSLQGSANPMFTPGCFEIGFNVGNETGAPLRSRLGIVSTHGAGCPDVIFALGIGLHVPDFVGSYQGYYTNVASSLEEDVSSSLEEDVSVYVRSRPESEAPPTTGPQTTGPPTTGPPTTGPPTTGPPTTGPLTTGPPTTELLV